MRFELGGVQFLADQHQARGTGLVGAPLAVEVLVEARAHALDQQAHRLVGDGGETLDPQDAVLDHQLGQGVQQQAFVGLGQLDGDGIEGVVIVVVVIVIAVMVMVVVAVAAVDVFLGTGTQAQQHIQGDRCWLR